MATGLLKVPTLLSRNLSETRDWVSTRALVPSTLPAYRRHSINTHQANEWQSWKRGKVAIGGQEIVRNF